MSRLTEKVKNINDYIKLPTKDKQEFINKLGKLEDIFELIEEMYSKPVYWKYGFENIFSEDFTQSTILYNHKTNEIEIYEYEFIASYKVEEYGKTWAFTEEELKDKE